MKQGSRRPGAGMAPKMVKNKKKTAKRLLGYITKNYKKEHTNWYILSFGVFLFYVIDIIILIKVRLD